MTDSFLIDALLHGAYEKSLACVGSLLMQSEASLCMCCHPLDSACHIFTKISAPSGPLPWPLHAGTKMLLGPLCAFQND